jgi:hypothetical protein
MTLLSSLFVFACLKDFKNATAYRRTGCQPVNRNLTTTNNNVMFKLVGSAKNLHAFYFKRMISVYMQQSLISIAAKQKRVKFQESCRKNAEPFQIVAKAKEKKQRKIEIEKGLEVAVKFQMQLGVVL